MKSKMKKLIFIALTALMMVGCGLSVESDTKACIKRYHVIILDSCEYYSNTMTFDLTHKGNCRFCEERRKKESKE
jgi:uncharacterized protein YcfL